MRIMFILATYEIGGVSTVARNILDSLGKNRFSRIVFLVERLSGRYPIADDNIKLVDLGITAQKGFFAKVFNIARHLRLMRRHIIVEKPDVILSFTSLVNCYAILSLLFFPGKKPRLIITEHSEQLFILRRIYRAMILLLYPGADRIMMVSMSLSKRIKRLFTIDPRRVKTVHNPVNIARIRESIAKRSMHEKGLFCIGTISRLSSEKGINFLIEGFKILLGKIDARLVIVGDGVDRLKLENRVKDLNIKEKVVFTGYMDDPFGYLAGMDVFVLPSLWEGFPNVVLEAMACGVPVIASDSSGGIREIIENGVNGLLIKPASPTAISDSISDLLSNKKKKESIIREAYKSIERFDVNKVKKEYENLIFTF